MSEKTGVATISDSAAMTTTREKKPIAVGERGLVLRDHAEMYAFSQQIAKTKMKPNGYSADDVFVAILTGSEYGFSPIRSLTAVPVINGRPTLEGKAMLALIQTNQCDDPRGPIDCGCEGEDDERIGWCESWRKGWPEPRRTEFTWKQAKRAGLANGNVYQKYGEDMVMWKAVGRHVNKYYADISHGLMLEVTGQEVYGQPGTTIATVAADMTPPAAAPAAFLGVGADPVREEAQDAEVVTSDPVAPVEESTREIVEGLSVEAKGRLIRSVMAEAEENAPTQDQVVDVCGIVNEENQDEFCLEPQDHTGRCDWDLEQDPDRPEPDDLEPESDLGDEPG